MNQRVRPVDNILNFLYDHIAKSGDIQARVHWQPNTVVLWDNRVTAHVSDLLCRDFDSQNFHDVLIYIVYTECYSGLRGIQRAAPWCPHHAASRKTHSSPGRLKTLEKNLENMAQRL